LLSCCAAKPPCLLCGEAALPSALLWRRGRTL